MTCVVAHTTVDAADPYRLSLWWSQVLGYGEDPDDPNLPDHVECLIRSADQTHALLFIRVPDEKPGKNRLHLDLRPVDGTRDEEVARLLAIGAMQYEDHRRPDGSGWVTLLDPEGNEFCVLRSLAEVEAGPTL